MRLVATKDLCHAAIGIGLIHDRIFVEGIFCKDLTGVANEFFLAPRDDEGRPVLSLAYLDSPPNSPGKTSFTLLAW